MEEETNTIYHHLSNVNLVVGKMCVCKKIGRMVGRKSQGRYFLGVKSSLSLHA